MSKVTDCARELGQAIVDSEEYKTMQMTEKTAMSDPAVAAAMSRYLEAKDNMHAAMSMGDADQIALQPGDGRRAAGTQCVPAVDAMTTARQNFSELMNQVNHVLEFMITGEVEQGGGCTGNCASCGGATEQRTKEKADGGT